MAIAIVTDSTADLDPARARAMRIGVVPLFVVWGDRSYRDYVDLSHAQFYDKLASEPSLPITSQPTAAMFEEVFAPFVAAGDEIMCLTVSSTLSGTINGAQAAAARFPEATIHVVDSRSATGGLGLQVMHARALADAGLGASEILAELERERCTQGFYACIPDLTHLVRTGRIGRARAAVGTLMRIVPILTLKDGEVIAQAQVRTFARAQETMLDLALEHITNAAQARFLVLHTNAPELARTALERLHERLGDVQPKMLEIFEAGPAIAVHAGPGAVGLICSQD